MRRLKPPPRHGEAEAGPLFGGRPAASLSSQTWIAHATRLTSLYELWFDYVAQEAQGAPPPVGAVGSTLAAIRTLEATMPDQEVAHLYAQAVAGYHLDTGRCHRSGCGRTLPCDCPKEVP